MSFVVDIVTELVNGVSVRVVVAWLVGCRVVSKGHANKGNEDKGGLKNGQVGQEMGRYERISLWNFSLLSLSSANLVGNSKALDSVNFKKMVKY